MSNELVQAIQLIAEEKKLSVESIQETIELALAAAYRKDFGNKLQNIKVDFDINTGSSRVYDIKTVVEDSLEEEYRRELEEKAKHDEQPKTSHETVVAKEKTTTTNKESEEKTDEEEIKFNPKTMVGLTAAREIQTDITVDQDLIQELEIPQDYGRMAAQTAKQVIIQKIREAERENTYNTFKDKEHELVTGMVQRVEPRVVLVDIDKSTAVMPIKEQIENEHYRVGTRMKFYIKEVNQTPKGPEILLSRNHPEILRKLFSIEVPEIASGTVVIKSIAREAGSRSKIAVTSKEDNIDPIGACVGQRGSRVQTIINELGGEKIDIIEHSEDIGEFITNALSPAKVLSVELDEEERVAKAYVREDQLSLAIGKGGQNVRLAARLSGWRLDILEENTGETKMTSEDGGEDKTASDEQIEELTTKDVDTAQPEPTPGEPEKTELTKEANTSEKLSEETKAEETTEEENKTELDKVSSDEADENKNIK